MSQHIDDLSAHVPVEIWIYGCRHQCLSPVRRRCEERRLSRAHKERKQAFSVELSAPAV